MKRPTTDAPQTDAAKLQLGIFGDTRSGKTVYLTALHWAAKHAVLPASIRGVRPADNESARYLGDRVAMVEAGRWPEGTVDGSDLHLMIDKPNGDVIALKTKDFRGGDFGKAFYTGNSDDAKAFLRDLFGDCNAYLFLIDPGSLVEFVKNRGDEKEHQASEQRTGGVLPALEIIRRRTRGFKKWHPPVAVVFTKADQHPEVAADPAEFAQRYAQPIRNYLRTHAPHTHAFFAVSSTGPLEASNNGPPTTLRPKGIFAPFIWAEQVHRRVVRSKRRTLLGCLGILLLIAYVLLFFLNRSAIEDQRTVARQTPYDQLIALHRSVAGSSARYLLTHPRDHTRLVQDIVGEAESRLSDEWKSRLDGGARIRTIDDYLLIQPEINGFASGFPGTENASRLKAWEASERYRLAGEAMELLKKEVEEEKELRFNEVLERYAKVAVPAFDVQVVRARDELYLRIGVSKVQQIWKTYDETAGRLDVDRMRGDIADVEKALQVRPQTPEEHRTLLALFGELYDDVKTNDRRRTLHIKLESEYDYGVKWSLKVGDLKEHVADSGDFKSPSLTSAPKWYAVDCELSMDVLSLKPGDVLVLKANMDTRFGNGIAEWSKPIRDLPKLLPSMDQTLTTSEAYRYKMVFPDDDASKSLKKALDLIQRIEALGDKLYRQRQSGQGQP